MNPNNDRDIRQRLEQVEQERAILQQQLELQQHAANYEVTLGWPAQVTGNRLTQVDLIQHRLLEAGIVYDAPTRTAELLEATNDFIQDMEATDCYHSVGVEIGQKAGMMEESDDFGGTAASRRLHVNLKEKNWYRLHAGAGLKADMFNSSATHKQQQVATDAVLPPAEFELSVGLRNLAGCFDKTELQYTLDTLNVGAWRLSHNRPLYTVLPRWLGDNLLETDVGSQHTFSAQAALDTIDSDWISSYKLFQRYVSLKMESTKSKPGWASLEWYVGYRDLIPRRHAHLPFHLAASPEITTMAGPSLKHAITANVEYDDTVRDPTSLLPVDGVQLRWRTECALPPGDVGFLKTNATCAFHWLVPQTPLALHATGFVGYLQQLHFTGTRPITTLPSDRFLLGGPGSLRGFAHGGVGPRSRPSGKNRIGDVLGGNLAYSATAMISTMPPYSVTKGEGDPIRLFGFVTAGTCQGSPNYQQHQQHHLGSLWSDTRVAVGVGIASQVLGPRLEATYAWPLRYSPRDGRRRFQLGVTLSVT